MSEISKLNGYDIKDATSRTTLSDHETRISNIENTTIPALDTRVETLETSGLTEMIVIGDSFSSRTYLSEEYKLWCEIVADTLNLNLHNYADPGSGYVHQGDERDSTFYSQLNEAYTDSSFSNDNVKYVFIYGGTNDLRYGSSDVKSTYTTAYSDTMARARTYFPKAIIYYLGCNTFSSMYIKTMNDTEKITELWVDYNVKNSNGYKNNCISCIDLTFFYIGMSDYFTDGLYSHPNYIGHIGVADAVIKGITGSSLAFNHHVSTSITISSNTSTWTTSNTLTGDNKFDLYLTDKNVELYLAGCFTSSEASSFVNVEIPYNIRFPYNRLQHYTPQSQYSYAIAFSTHGTSGITSQGSVTTTYNQGTGVINIYKNYADAKLIYDIIHKNKFEI